MDGQLLGETAALGASVLWTFTSIAFTVASRKVGPLNVNMWRMAFALGLLAITHIIVLGTLLPAANSAQWFYMGLSGIIGLALGDLGYFGGLMILGPRRGTLLMATNPIFSALTGAVVLGEMLSSWAVLGIGVTLFGVTLVVLEKQDGAEPALTPRKNALGIVAGLVGSVGQGVGLVVSKYGMMDAATGDPLDPLSATLMRMVTASAFFFIAMLVMRKTREMKSALGDREGMKATVAGTVLGPYLGVWIFMLAVSNAKAGVVATLGSLMPVFIIPVVYVLYRQKTSWRGVLGAVIAITGVAILMLM